ncbi:hypothetical protein ACFL00_04225 [Pseudomonadota bacterium]
MRKVRPGNGFTVILMILILALPQVAAAKPGKGGGGNPGGEDPGTYNGSTCINSSSTFPAFAYTKLIIGGRKGTSVTGYEIYVSNEDGDCSVLVYASSAAYEDYSDLSYRQIGNDGVIAWRQYADETVSGGNNSLNDLIKVIRFEVIDQAVVTQLPLSADVVANSGDKYIGYPSIDLSRDGNTILFIHADSVTRAAEDVVVWTIREMDISNCSSNCDQSVLFSSSDIENLHNVSYGLGENRIYFSGGIHTNSGDDRASQGYIAFIEYVNGAWSTRRELTYQGNGYYGTDYSGSSTFKDISTALIDLGNGVPSEALSYTFFNVTSGQAEVHVIDVGSCSVSASGDCLSSGESSLVAEINDARFSSLGGNYMYFSSDSSDDIYRYDFGSSSLTSVALGNEVASGD